MKVQKRLFSVVAALLVAATCFADKRIPEEPLNNRLVEAYVKYYTSEMSAKDIIEWSNKTVSHLLYFQTNSKLKSLSQLSLTEQIPTHCVGYCRTYTAICNYAFRVNGIKAKAYHMRGPVKMLGVDCTKLVSSSFYKLGMKRAGNFTKDHDYVVVKYDGKSKKVDPLLYDVLH